MPCSLSNARQDMNGRHLRLSAIGAAVLKTAGRRPRSQNASKRILFRAATLHFGRCPALQGRSAHADKCAPYSGENGTSQNVSWTTTERAAVSAHFHAQRADLLITGGI